MGDGPALAVASHGVILFDEWPAGNAKGTGATTGRRGADLAVSYMRAHHVMSGNNSSTFATSSESRLRRSQYATNSLARSPCVDAGRF